MQQTPIEVWVLNTLAAAIALGMIFAIWRAYRNGVTLPPLGRIDYRRSVPPLVLANMAYGIVCFCLFMFTNQNWYGMLGMIPQPLFIYIVMRRGLQRYHDIDGVPVRNLFRALVLSRRASFSYLSRQPGISEALTQRGHR